MGFQETGTSRQRAFKLMDKSVRDRRQSKDKFFILPNNAKKVSAFVKKRKVQRTVVCLIQKRVSFKLLSGAPQAIVGQQQARAHT